MIALKARFLVVWYVVMGILMGSVSGDLIFGNCTEPQIEQIKDALKEAQDVANVTALRLQPLLDLVRDPSKTEGYVRGNEMLKSTFNTYASFVDQRLENIFMKPLERRGPVLQGLYEILGRSICLRDQIASVLTPPPKMSRLDKAKQITKSTVTKAPNIDIECSSNWIKDRGPEYDWHERYRDNRIKEIRGDSDLFTTPANDLPFTGEEWDQPLLLIINGLSSPYPSVLSINPDMFDNWLIPAKKRQNLSDILNNDNLEDGQVKIADLFHYQASSDLLTMLADNSTLAMYTLISSRYPSDAQKLDLSLHITTDEAGKALPFQWPPRYGNFSTLPIESGLDAQCVIGDVDHDADSWECLQAASSKFSNIVSFYRPYTYKYLAMALYLENYDWSLGHNKNKKNVKLNVYNRILQTTDRAALEEEPKIVPVENEGNPVAQAGHAAKHAVSAQTAYQQPSGGNKPSGWRGWIAKGKNKLGGGQGR